MSPGGNGRARATRLPNGHADRNHKAHERAKTAEGLVFTSITHRLEIHVAPGQIERARGVVVSAKKHCIVSNSLKTPVEVVAEIG